LKVPKRVVGEFKALINNYIPASEEDAKRVEESA